MYSYILNKPLLLTVESPHGVAPHIFLFPHALSGPCPRPSDLCLHHPISYSLSKLSHFSLTALGSETASPNMYRMPPLPLLQIPPQDTPFLRCFQHSETDLIMAANLVNHVFFPDTFASTSLPFRCWFLCHIFHCNLLGVETCHMLSPL